MSRLIKRAAVDSCPLVLELRTEQPAEAPDEQRDDHEQMIQQKIAQAEQQAQEIIQKARLEADSLLEKAKAEAEELKISAQHQGYQDGINQAEQQAEAIRRQAREVLAQAEQARADTIDALEDEITALAVEIAEKVLTAQLTINPETVMQVAAEAVQMVRDRERITIYVNPADQPIYTAKKAELEEILSQRAVLTIIADETIKPGGCLVDTDEGLVDATVDARWQEVLQAVLPSQ